MTPRLGVGEEAAGLGTEQEQLIWEMSWLVGSVLKVSEGHHDEQGEQALKMQELWRERMATEVGSGGYRTEETLQLRYWVTFQR